MPKRLLLEIKNTQEDENCSCRFIKDLLPGKAISFFLLEQAPYQKCGNDFMSRHLRGGEYIIFGTDPVGDGVGVSVDQWLESHQIFMDI